MLPFQARILIYFNLFSKHYALVSTLRKIWFPLFLDIPQIYSFRITKKRGKNLKPQKPNFNGLCILARHIYLSLIAIARPSNLALSVTIPQTKIYLTLNLCLKKCQKGQILDWNLIAEAKPIDWEWRKIWNGLNRRRHIQGWSFSLPFEEEKNGSKEERSCSIKTNIWLSLPLWFIRLTLDMKVKIKVLWVHLLLVCGLSDKQLCPLFFQEDDEDWNGWLLLSYWVIFSFKLL